MVKVYLIETIAGESLLLPLRDGHYVGFHLDGKPHFDCLYPRLPEGRVQRRELLEMPYSDYKTIRGLFSDYHEKQEAALESQRELNAAAADIIGNFGKNMKSAVKKTKLDRLCVKNGDFLHRNLNIISYPLDKSI